MLSSCRAVIVIPCLNEEAYIEDGLKSILAAIEYCDAQKIVEVVIVDGGSKDKTVNKISTLSQQSPTRILLLKENKSGIGYARKRGVRFALHRALNRQKIGHKDFWIVSTDADTKVPRIWIEDWVEQFNLKKSPILVGNKIFPPNLSSEYPKAYRLLTTINKLTNKVEGVFGTINFDGTNSAIERECYSVVGPFEQPCIRKQDGTFTNLAGEDWDVGARARLLGISVIRTKTEPVITSARRFRASPIEYLNGETYEKEFIRPSKQSPDIGGADIWQTEQAAVLRLCVHFIEKPILCDPTIIKKREIASFLGTSLVKSILEWLTKNPRPDMFLDRNSFILNYLGYFHRVLGKKISERVIWFEKQ